MKNNIIKYFKTVCICILIVSFLTGLISFLLNIKNYLMPRKIIENPTDSSILADAKTVEKELTSLKDDLEKKYGDEYPSLGILYYRAFLHYSSVTVIQNFLFGLIGGFGLGNIIYIVFIKKYKKLDLIIFFFISLFITSFFFGLSDILSSYANNEKIDYIFANILINLQIVSIPYFVITFILKIIEKITSTFIEIRNS